jgi:hypothetical protein
MAKLDISNVIRVTLLSALQGLSDINTSALALITDEVPISTSYGTSRIYLSPTSVATDFGSASETYRLAVKVFQQNPNILSGGGFLVIIPRLASAAAQPAVLLSSGPVNLLALTAVDYNLRAAVDGGAAANIVIGDLDLTDLASAEASLNAYTIETAGLIFELSGELSAAYVKLYTDTEGASSAIALTTATAGTDIASLLGLSGSATGAASGVERVKDAILRTCNSLDYFGIILNEKMSNANLTETANLVQTMDKLLFVGSSTLGDIAGIFTTLQGMGLSHTRALYYSLSEADALDFEAGYASRGLCINFAGSNTAHTMHLKEVLGLDADSGLTQTVLNAAKVAGVDVYADFGVSKLMTSGANMYFDQIYTRLAFKLKIAIAGFNYLATTTSKIPQTEEGMGGLKGAYRKVCEQFVRNGVFAPGEWLSSTTFGAPEDHIRNIKDLGYFIYSLPIALQSAADRAARVAPVCQIAAKDAGAIHSADVIVYVEN